MALLVVSLSQVLALRQPPVITRRDGLRALLAATSAGAALPVAADPTYKSSVTLSDGSVFPLASFGLQLYDDAMAQRLTALALEAGFRNFFASVLANNQRGFAKAVKQSSVPRADCFICGSVVSNRAQDEETAYKLTKLGCAENAEAFGTGGIDELDMIMLDYPGPDDACIRGQWRAFEEMRKEGRVRSLAVSNFSPQQLDVILAMGGTKPTANQLAFCVGYHDPGLVGANAKRGVHVQAWSPLGNGRLTRFRRDAPAIREACEAVGRAHGKSAEQVALRFITQAGASFTVQASSGAHFADDVALFDFELTGEEMRRLEALNVQPSWEGSVTQA